MAEATRILPRERGGAGRHHAGRRASAPTAQGQQRLVAASLGRRILGAAIDTCLLLLVSGMLSARIAGTAAGTSQVRIGADGARSVLFSASEPLWLPLLVFTLLTAAYVVPLMALWGRTLGGWCVGIRCVRTDSGSVPGWGVSLRRWLLLYGIAGVLAFAPVVGAWAWLVTLVVGLSPAWDGSGRLRGYADRFAGDIVVRAPSRLGMSGR